ncbi:hypothetical protein ACH5RR_004968 [Cinchona calisaya]|uniref:Clathrin light chain n=1 Tax=Cinchona calisaya TaxID=153742 RepID=A0ABD3AZ20_9GENT
MSSSPVDKSRPGGQDSRLFEDDNQYIGFDSRFSSQRFDSKRFESFYSDADESSKGIGLQDSSYGAGDDVFGSQLMNSADMGRSTSGPVLSPAADDMHTPPAEEVSDSTAALKEWRRQNAIRLEEKEKREKEMLKEIIKEAVEYKEEYYKKWKLRSENNKAINREKEKVFLDGQEKFHAEASKNFWNAIGELIPNEVPTISKKGKKDKEKKPTVVVIQGPKPGKPTDLSRMRHILVKLKHNPGPVTITKPSTSETGGDTKPGTTNPAAHAPAKSAVK